MKPVMDICIFCKRSPPEVAMSEEHVVPDSMGGAFVLRSVCKSCNDRLGHDVDVLLADNPLIQMIRLGLHVTNRYGELPTPLRDGELLGMPGFTASYEQKTPDARGKVRVMPKRTSTTSPDGKSTLIEVWAPRGETQGILDKIAERHRRRGAKEVKVHRTGQREVQGPTVRKTHETNGLAIFRPLLKIAYEMAAHWIGPGYLNDPQAPDLCAAVTTGTIHNVDVQVNYCPDESMFAGPGLHSYCHVVALASDGTRVWCCIRIFNVIEAAVLVSEHATMHTFVLQSIVLDPISRTAYDLPAWMTSAEARDPHPAEILWERPEPEKIVVRVMLNGVENALTEIDYGKFGKPPRPAESTTPAEG